jgi:hypothetical protein
MDDTRELDGASVPQMPPDPGSEILPPWEMIENGRYQPRRIRGSFPGRELG